jgi:hypothetical protein
MEFFAVAVDVEGVAEAAAAVVGVAEASVLEAVEGDD